MLNFVVILMSIVWFAAHGVLWVWRPNETIWLAASVVLGAVYFSGFMWYLARRDKSSKL